MPRFSGIYNPPWQRVKFLVDRGPNPAKVLFGQTISMQRRLILRMAKLLILYISRLDQLDNEKRSALHYASASLLEYTCTEPMEI